MLGHFLYRKVLIWTVASLVLVAIILFRGRDVTIPDVVQYGKSKLSPSHEAAGDDNSKGDDDGELDHEIVVVVQDDAEEGLEKNVEEDVKTVEEHVEDQVKEQVEEHVEQQVEGQVKEKVEEHVEQQVEEHVEQHVEQHVEEQAGEQVGQQVEEKPTVEQQELSEEEKQRVEFDEQVKEMPWLLFKHLDGYFHGLKALVQKSHHVPEYPNQNREAPFPPPPLNYHVPKPRPYDPYRLPNNARTCYLDRGNTVRPPAIYAYDGVPQHMPDPVLGSYELFGIRDDVCFDRFGRYGPYGLGYKRIYGGLGVGIETESSSSEAVWAETGQLNYNSVDWGDAQERCSAANKHRFLEPDEETEELPTAPDERKDKKGRIAIVVRCYQGFRWTELATLNFRAMVTELSLKSGGEYTVHLLLHVHDTNLPIWAEDVTVQRLLDANIPPEFHSLVTLWSEPQMQLFYPGDFPESPQNPSGGDVHGVYRSAHMALQVFAMQHPEYEHFWNWEMDLRSVGNFYELLNGIGSWADNQPRSLIWERSARYYIPAYHGSWDNFTKTVRMDTVHSGEKTIFGPVTFAGRKPLRHEQGGRSVLPESCAFGQDPTLCGVGEGADFITLNPIFDTNDSGWVFADDLTGYRQPTSSDPPRRSSIVTVARLSRRLLAAMHEEVWRHHHTMFTEMFPSTIALHHGLKAVYAPHPVYFDRAWQPLGSAVDDAFNSGEYHSTSGKHSIFDTSNEHNHKGTSWYYHSEFAGLLWRRWLGYSQMDGRGQYGGQGTERGGVFEESASDGSGRMCLRSMLLHPIKYELPSERP
ncbi:hypothetical protein TOPH_06458 [Tolypocladium ophioglossoides CBS 100239]|uniref:Major facilitator superfamily transporter n=1 Tax=Tolypocladium ophioglossoides (strain CBS 100239) TaxID=1163406 RepID=A0A0L0N4D7_TOLOC|nr:hypothetical protein TOPH_06458 [Tolypocladium ophioglossoides CBS 100239]